MGKASTEYMQAFQTGGAGDGVDIQKLMIPRRLFQVLEWSHPELTYAYHSVGDPMQIMFYRLGAPPDVLLRVAAGFNDAVGELCEMALTGALSFATLEERMDYIRELLESESMDPADIMRFAAERYRQIECGEFYPVRVQA
ncbi:MAG: hypothetical protein P8J37_08975 [Fuerstiella sp.]|nr:hypothetical protein [Fuerstiella sp.]